MSGAALIECSRLHKWFPQPDGSVKTVVDDVSLSIADGEFVSFVGPSGCGKTTLLKMIAGIIPVSSGRVTFDHTERPMTPRDYGMVFQQAALLPWRTVLSNALLPADLMRLNSGKAKVRARELLSLMKLEPSVPDLYPSELSGGMQQRVAIARALLHQPRVLLMDEPFGALDAMTRESLNMHLQEVHRIEKRTVIFVTHSISEAVLLSDRIVVLHANPGRIAEILTTDLPRPRRIADTSSEAFRALELHVRGVLDRSERAEA